MDDDHGWGHNEKGPTAIVGDERRRRGEEQYTTVQDFGTTLRTIWYNTTMCGTVRINIHTHSHAHIHAWTRVCAQR